MDNLKEFNTKTSDGGKGKNVAIIVLAILLIGLAVYHKLDKNKSTETIITVSEEKATLTYQYQGLLDDYESLEVSNDSIQSQLSSERERIKEIMIELRSTKANNKAQIKKYEAELKTMREIMKSFIVQIDSLNQSNIALRSENKEIKEQFFSERQKSTELSDNLDQEREKVAIASVIRAINMSFESYNHKAKLTNKAKKVVRLAIGFTLDENPIAPRGKKRIYVRFTDPENHVLIYDTERTFNFEGEDIAYSDFKDIEYDGSAVRDIVFYENKGENLIQGLYKVDVFCDGHTIGASSLELK